VRTWLIERSSWIAYEPGTDGVNESECIEVIEKSKLDLAMEFINRVAGPDGCGADIGSIKHMAQEYRKRIEGGE
jgi:hypothetical protein